MNILKNNYFLLLSALFLVGALILTVLYIRENQERRSQALKATTLSLTPASTQTNPIRKNVNDQFTIDIMADPGSNFVTLVHAVILYDETKLQPVTPVFERNRDLFPLLLDEPVATPGRLSFTVSVGSDPTQAVTETAKIGTVTFKAIGPTSTQPAVVRIDTTSEVLSAAPNDQAAENVLETTIPAFVVIEGTTPRPTPTTFPGTLTPTTRPSITNTPTVTRRPSPSVSPTPAPLTLKFTVFLHGLGNSGDNPNPTAHSLSNKNPLRKSRPLVVELINTQQQLVATTGGTINYQTTGGNFVGTAGLDSTFPSGQYIIKVRSDGYLKKYVPGIVSLTQGNVHSISGLTLVTGDTNSDNALNILDYNRIRDCYSDNAPAISCEDIDKRTETDVTDDGDVNQYDYNLFLREISVQHGD